MLFLWTVGLALTAQNNTPTFVVDYQNGDTTTVAQSGIGFASNADGTQYSISKNGLYQDNLNLNRVKSISRYYEPPVTHVYSDEASSEAIVKEVKDGTVALDAATAKDVPHVGEIIVSGVTDAAPYGFLRRVEGVEEKDGNIILKTSQASLNEVLYNTHIEHRLQLKEADGSAASSYSSLVNGLQKINNLEWFHFKKKFDIFENPGGKLVILGKEIDEYCKGSVNVDMTLGSTFIWDSGWLPDRCGIILDGSLSLSVAIEAGLKLEKDEDKLTWKIGPEIPLEPIVFPAGMVPVVIVPVIQFKWGIRSAEGKLYAKWKPIDIEAAAFEGHLIWNREENINGENWEYGASCSSDFSDLSVEGMFQDMLNAEAGLSGEAKLSVWPEVRFQLYDCDNVSMAIGLAPYAKLSGELAVKWQKSNSEDVLEDFELKDDISFSGGFDVPLEGKLKFNILGKVIGGTKNASLTILNKDFITFGSLIPVFNNFRITPEDNVKEWDNVHVSSYEGLSLLSKYEDDFGYCIAEVKKDNNGMELTKDWEYHSLKSKYAGNTYGKDGQLKIEWDIPTSDLLPNATYEVKPYTKLNLNSTQYTFWRKGGTFETGGVASLQLSTTSLTLTSGSQGTVEVTSGSGSYEAASNAKNVATVTVEGSKIIITAVSPGPATITVKDNKTQERAKIEVTVSEAGQTQTETFTVNGVSFKMVGVEGGTFWMGAADDDPDADSDERPRHQVTLSSFSIGQTEVTQELWEAVMGENPSYRKGANLPVEQVSWNDCQTFISKLNAMTGKNFRLLTEAEWEYAARGGKQSHGYTYAGSNDIEAVAWYASNSSSQTHPVAQKQANELGFYDMSGNVWEWCQDWYSGSYYSNSPSTNPCNTTGASDRVRRGGSWVNVNYAGSCRVAKRAFSAPDDYSHGLGLRLVLSDGGSSPQSYLTCPDDHHPHLIDLGLPSGTKWACCNVNDDASKQSPTNYVGYYAWGETEEKDCYGTSTYIYLDIRYSPLSYIYHDLGSDIAGTQYDVAHVKWGGSWVMPSKEQQDELRDNCIYVWTTVNGVNGMVFTGPNGGSIFLPAANCFYGSVPVNAGSYVDGYYWSSTQHPSRSREAYALRFGSYGGVDLNFHQGRDVGQSVRPVVSN